MANFFEERRVALLLTRTHIAARVNTVSESVRQWEAERAIPRPTIASLAKAYEVTEEKMAREVMALRQRIEKREAKQTAGAGK